MIFRDFGYLIEKFGNFCQNRSKSVGIGRKWRKKCEQMVKSVKIGPETVKLALAKMTTWQFLYFGPQIGRQIAPNP